MKTKRKNAMSHLPSLGKYWLGLLLFMLPSLLFAQAKTISGTVTDDGGKPVEAASVTLKGKKTGTQTDATGRFSITAEVGETLLVTAINFDDREMKVGSEANYIIGLKTKAGSSLNDVVVVGYGSQRKGSLTGAIATVDKKLIENRPVTNAVAALQGTAPGLVVTRTGGQPGAEGYNLNIRGFSSINGTNSPLVIIDGVEGDITQLNPNDIQSVSVLKDAAASSIYGAKAGSGVVLVTTKKGAAGQFHLSYSGQYSINKPSLLPTRVSSYEGALQINASRKNSGTADVFTAAQLALMQLSDTATEILNPGQPNQLITYLYNLNQIPLLMKNTTPYQQHNLQAAGGNDKTQYLFSMGYLNQDGLFKFGPDGYKRYNARVNVNTRFSKIFSLDARLAYIEGRTEAPSQNPAGLVGNTYQSRTTNPIFLPGSNETKYAGAPSLSPNYAYQILKDGGYDKTFNRSVNGMFNLKAENFIKGASVQLVYSPQLQQINENIFSRRYELWTYNPYGTSTVSYNNNPNYYQQLRTTALSQNVQALLNYDWNIASDHHFHVLGGFEYRYYNYDYMSARANALVSNDVPSLNYLSNPSNVPQVSNNVQSNAFVSYFGRFNYNYKEKYLLEASIRNDASSQLAPGYRSITYPSVSLGWRLTKENWFNDALPFFSEFKLRGSWGKQGNAQLGNPYTNNYNYIAQLNTGSAYPFNNVSNPTIYQGSQPSPTQGWETIITTDGGIDIGMFKNRLTASFDYYVRKNNNMLIAVPAPAQFGLASGFSNSASLKTKGWDASIGWRDKINNKIDYWINLNMDDNTNVVTKYAGQNIYNAGLNRVIEGESINTIFGYQDIGYFTSADDVAKSPSQFGFNNNGAGDIKYKDQNGDGKINGGLGTKADHGDLVNLGNTAPRYNFGINLGAAYKGFDLSVLINGTGKRATMINPQEFVPFTSSWLVIWDKGMLDSWTPENTDARYPRPYAGGATNTQYSNHWVQNAAYIRLKNLQVGYTIPPNALSRLKIQSVRIFFSGQDIWESSKMWMKVLQDPENPANTSFQYPFFRSYAFGLNVTF